MALSAKVVTMQTGTGSSNIAVTGVGFQPKALVFLGAKQSTTGQGAHAHFGMGFGVSSSQRGAVYMQARDAVSTTVTGVIARNDACWGISQDATVASYGRLNMVSLDSDGFTVIPSLAFSADLQVSVLCIGGDSLTNAAVLTVNLGSGTGTQSFTGAGFLPDAVLAIGAGHSVFNGTGTGGGFSLGWATSTSSRGCIGVESRNGTTGTQSKSILRTDRLLSILRSDASGVAADIDFSSFDSDGLTINRVSHDSGSTEPIVFLGLKGASVKIGSVAANTSTGTAATSSVGFKPAALLMASTNATTTTQTSPNTGLELMVGFATAATERASAWAIDEDSLGTSDNQHRYDAGGLWIDYAGSTGFAIEGEAELSSFDSDGFTLDTVDAFPAANLAVYMAIGPSAASSTLTQEGYQWYADDGNESGSSTLAAQDTGITRAAGSVGRIRMLVDATGDPATKQY